MKEHSIKKEFFSVEGRFGRKDLWIRNIIMMLSILFFSIFGENVKFIVSLLLIPYSFCCMIRRAHDLNVSYWKFLFLGLFLWGLLLVPAILPRSWIQVVFGMLTLGLLFAYSLYTFYLFFLKRGTIGPNKYGEDPTKRYSAGINEKNDPSDLSNANGENSIANSLAQTINHPFLKVEETPSFYKNNIPNLKNSINDISNIKNLLSEQEYNDLSESLTLAISSDYNGRNWFEVAVISLYRGSDFDKSVYYLAHDGWNNLGQFEKDTCRRYFQNKVKESILLTNGLENTESNWQKALQGLDFILAVNPELKGFINLVKENVTEEELKLATEESFCSGFVDWLKNNNDIAIDNILRDIYFRTEQGISRQLRILHDLNLIIYSTKEEQIKKQNIPADSVSHPAAAVSYSYKKNKPKLPNPNCGCGCGTIMAIIVLWMIYLSFSTVFKQLFR